VILGWLLSRTGSVWAPSLGHASMNAVFGSLILLMYPDPGQRIYLVIFAWLPLAAICMVLYFADRRPARPAAETLP